MAGKQPSSLAKQQRAAGAKKQAAKEQSLKAAEGAHSGIPDSAFLPDIAFWVLLFLTTLAAYWPALQGAVLWDDDQHLTKPAMQSLHGLWRIWFELGSTAQYYPLLHSAFWIEHGLWGDEVLGYHLLNVTLHAISAALVVLIVRHLKLPGAWLAGFVFAVHPVCVEAVAWISEQKSTLSGAFFLAAALAYLHFDRGRRRLDYFVALGLFVMAVLSKTTTSVLPAVLLVVLWWQRGRLEWQRDVQPLLPWFGIGVPAGLFTAWVERTYIGAQGAGFSLGMEQRVLLAGRALWFYASKLVWPVNLTFSYPRWRLDPTVWWQWLFPAGAVAVAGLLLWIARKHRGPLAGFLIFAGTLVPALGFLNVYPFRYSYVADHFQYLASLGIIIPLASALAIATGRIPWRGVQSVAPAALVAVLGLLTLQQSGMYSDSVTLYRETIARNPESWLAHNNLGSALVTMPGQVTEAIAEYRGAVRIEPDYPEGHFNLGAALVSRHDPELEAPAIAEYQIAIRLKPNYPEAHNNLGNALSHIPGRMDDAIAEFQTALRLRPEMAAHLGLGNALAQTPGRLGEAEAEYRTALRLKPDYVEAHFNLGNVLAQMPGREAEAIAEYQAVLQIRPDADAAREMIERLQGAR